MVARTAESCGCCSLRHVGVLVCPGLPSHGMQRVALPTALTLPCCPRAPKYQHLPAACSSFSALLPPYPKLVLLCPRGSPVAVPRCTPLAPCRRPRWSPAAGCPLQILEVHSGPWGGFSPFRSKPGRAVLVVRAALSAWFISVRLAWMWLSEAGKGLGSQCLVRPREKNTCLARDVSAACVLD